MTDDLLELALQAASGAGALLLERFGAPAAGVGTKSGPTDPVSDADRAAEAYLRSAIAKERPQDGIRGEEDPPKATSSGVTWTIDPLDGTVNYLYGVPWWAISVGVCDAEGDLVGVVHDPVRGDTFCARRGEGATLNSKSISVTGCTQLAEALIATGFAYDSSARKVQAEVVASLLPQVRDIRRMGSAALDLCAVASGRVDGFYEATLEEWDKAAGRLIVKEAGGSVNEIDPPRSGLAPGLVAANPHLHDELKELVTAHGDR